MVRNNVLRLAVVVLDICLQRGSSGFSVMERIHNIGQGAGNDAQPLDIAGKGVVVVVAEAEELFLPTGGDQLGLGQGDLPRRGLGVLLLLRAPGFLNNGLDPVLGGQGGQGLGQEVDRTPPARSLPPRWAKSKKLKTPVMALNKGGLRLCEIPCCGGQVQLLRQALDKFQIHVVVAHKPVHSGVYIYASRPDSNL